MPSAENYRSWAGWFLGAVANICLGIPLALLIYLTVQVAQAVLHRLGWITDTSAERIFSDGLEIPSAMIVICWVFSVAVLLLINLGIVKFFGLRARFYGPICLALLLLPYIASSATPA